MRGNWPTHSVSQDHLNEISIEITKSKILTLQCLKNKKKILLPFSLFTNGEMHSDWFL